MSNINVLTNWFHKTFSLIHNVIYGIYHKKYKRKRVLSRGDFIQLCQTLSKRIKDKGCSNEYVIAWSTRALFISNNIERLFSDSFLTKCYVATLIGWEDADRILKTMAETGDAWSETYFDTNSTKAYIARTIENNEISNRTELELVRWSYKQGERLRVQYHTVPEFIDAFEKGKLYETEIILGDFNQHIPGIQFAPN